VRQQTGSAPHAAVACSVRPRSVFSCTDALTWRIDQAVSPDFRS